MILEAIVTTVDRQGVPNIAPMGPTVGPDPGTFLLRPFKTATTYRNLVATGAAVVHVTDDVWLVAGGAIGRVVDVAMRPASAVAGVILRTSGRYHEVRVVDVDDRDDRATVRVAVVASGEQAVPLFGLNRAQAAVVEAAILATRVDFLPIAGILADFDRLASPVLKTGGPTERLAFGMLADHVRAVAARGGIG